MATRTLQFFLVQMMILLGSLTRLASLTATTALASQVKPRYAAFLHLLLLGSIILNHLLLLSVGGITGLGVGDTCEENRPSLLANRRRSIEHHHIFGGVVYHFVWRYRGSRRRRIRRSLIVVVLRNRRGRIPTPTIINNPGTTRRPMRWKF